jgi:hypothetical protein
MDGSWERRRLAMMGLSQGFAFSRGKYLGPAKLRIKARSQPHPLTLTKQRYQTTGTRHYLLNQTTNDLEPLLNPPLRKGSSIVNMGHDKIPGTYV